MAKKRKCGDPPTDAAASKVTKSVAVEFTGTQFKNQLKSPEGVEKGLGTFISIAKQLPCSGLYDVVEGYIKISAECAEIFMLLDGETPTEKEMILIFQALEAILLRTASDLTHFTAVGMNIVKKVLHTYMKLIYSALFSASHRYARACLGLLSAMVSQGPEAARDFISHFDFNNKLLPGLLKKRERTGRPDVRMAYIQFAVSFLIAGDNNTIRQILELKDFIAGIFTSGLKEDPISVINLLLSTLKTKVVQNKAISKTQKIRLFSIGALNHIATLYRWSGTVDVYVNTGKGGQDSLVAGRELVRELVHSFLIDLCCSLKYGINFYDSSLGTAKRGGNVVLLRFLLGLKTATEDELVADLMVNILKVCPDLLNRFFKETQYSFVPRLKTVWLDNMKLLRKIYEAQPDICRAFQTKEYIPISRLLSMVMVTTVPPVATKAMFIQGISLANKVVQQTTLSLLAFVLKRALKNIEHCLNVELWQHSEIYTPSVMEDFTQQFREILSKHLPDMNTIVATWQSLLKNEDKDGKQGQEDEKDTENDTAVLETSDVTEDHVGDDAGTTVVKAMVLQVMCLYQKVVPHVVSQCAFDFSKLIKGIVSEKGVKKEVAPILQHCILQLALELPSNKFAWFRFQGITNTEKSTGEESVFYLLLKMYVTCKSSHLQASTKQLIVKVLKDTGIFEYTWNELELWMKGLHSVSESKQEIVILFLERVLIKLISNPYPYTDKISETIQEASTLQANLDGQDLDAVSLPISHIDDVLDMVDIIMDTSEGLNDEVGFTLSEEVITQTFPFSAVVTAALEARNKMVLGNSNGTDAVLQYLIATLTNILHVQQDPLALCLILQMYDKELDSFSENRSLVKNIFQFYTYYSLWIPQQAKESLFEQFGTERTHSVPLKEGSFCSLLMGAYKMRVSILSDEVKDNLKQAVAQLHLCELVLAVKQVMLYIRMSVANFNKLGRSTSLGLIALCMDLLKSLLQRCEQSEDIQEKLEKQENELFVDFNVVVDERTKEQVLESMLSAIFKHQTLEQWFMALELQAPPAHSLNPISFKMLSALLSSGTLSLLELSVPSLQRLGRMDMVLTYFKTIVESVLKELELKKLSTAKSAVMDKRTLPLEALENLNTYVDITWLKEIVASILELPEEYLAIKSNPEKGGDGVKQLGLYGKTLVKILTENHQKTPDKDDLLLSCDHFSAVGTLLQYSNSEELEKVFLRVLLKEPVFAQAVRPDVFLDCLNRMSEDSLSICKFLIQHSKTSLLQFELWCLESGRMKHLRKNMDAYLSLLSTYLECQEKSKYTRPERVFADVLKVIRNTTWKMLVRNIASDDPSDELDLQMKVLARLVQQFPSTREDVASIMEQLPAVLEKTATLSRWTLADAVTNALEEYPEDKRSWRKSLLKACIRWLVANYSSCKVQEEKMKETEMALLSRLQELLISVGEVNSDDWNSCVKNGLKYRYTDLGFLEALHKLIPALYEKEELAQNLIPLPMIHMMVTNHSLFLPTLLKIREDSDESSRIRVALIDVLLALVRLCPSVCNSNHFPVLLGAYGATLSITDQKLLLLLQSYEKNNISLAEFRLLFWGPAAVEHQKTCKSLGKSLWQQPSMEEILSLLDREKMFQTIVNFPQHRYMLPEEGKETLFKEYSIKEPRDLYDPCFLLPLFSGLITSESVVNCYKFVDTNAFGLTAASLSSYDPKIRAAAYHILGNYRTHLEAAHFKERRQLLYLLDVVKNGIREPNLRLTFCLAFYIAKVAQQMLKPEEHMYMKINHFLLAHQYLDLNKVPGFFKLFYSFNMEHKIEREWILDLLINSLKDKHCFELCNHQKIVHVLLGFFNSPLCDETAEYQIIQILLRAAHITKAAYQLIRDHNLLTWISRILQKRVLENRLMSDLISLLHTLWLTNLGNKETTQKFLPFLFINEFLFVLTILIQHIGIKMENRTFSKFLHTLSSVLQHQRGAFGDYKEKGWIVLNEKVLSYTEALLLLHKWSIVGRESHVQELLQNLAHKYNVKELQKVTKEKNKAKGLGWGATRYSRKKREEVQEDAENEAEESCLEECKVSLRSIFTNWDAQLPDETIDHQESQEEEDCAVKATIHIVVQWVVKSALENPISESQTFSLLGWLQRNLSRGAVTQELLKDSILWRHLLQFYSRVTNNVNGDDLTGNHLHLFTCTMLQLLEVRGLTDNYVYKSVIQPVCLPALKGQDHERKAAALVLLSDYLWDSWLGGQKPQLLLSHVSLTLQATEVTSRFDKSTKEKQKPTDAIVSLCKDINLLLERQ
ncbi:nucleolar pre-ribosomal-associated protein 1 [Pristis pectinata]|uniref:nucleolar pre-ribosomal-associated protein 1 n=1 Tax=Pristis pectinata TaxID=685728 RepID=UPI00223E7455|nr:nucleolar pre-ribosomal-associated protein 1 [Pristis pectinata]